METAFADLVLKYGLVGAIVVYAASKAVTTMFRSRTEVADANLQTAGKHALVDIIELMQRRMTILEEEQMQVRQELEEERVARAEADNTVDILMRRVAALEAQIRGLGHEPVQLP